MAVGAIIGAVIGIGGGIASAGASKKANKYAGKAADVRLQQQTMANAITRRDQIRNFRMLRAEATAAGASDGNVSSSSVSGSISSLGAQQASNLGYFERQASLDDLYNTYIKKSGRYQGQAANWSSVSQAGPAIGQLVSTSYNTLTAPKTTTTTTSSG